MGDVVWDLETAVHKPSNHPDCDWFAWVKRSRPVNAEGQTGRSLHMQLEFGNCEQSEAEAIVTAVIAGLNAHEASK